MDEIIDNILKINCLDYNDQYIHLKNKLLSTDPIDITHTVFFQNITCNIRKITKNFKRI